MSFFPEGENYRDNPGYPLEKQKRIPKLRSRYTASELVKEAASFASSYACLPENISSEELGYALGRLFGDLGRGSSVLEHVIRGWIRYETEHGAFEKLYSKFPKDSC